MHCFVIHTGTDYASRERPSASGQHHGGAPRGPARGCGLARSRRWLPATETAGQLRPREGVWG